ncbi:MAG TPA: hypothetical protein PK523_11955, partial [Elusimicrobiales bacterium]|nr:hypothetical protein [Elusimicrobiales bacterium]
MSINEEELRKIVAEVVKNLEASGAAPAAPSASSGSAGPVFDTVDQAVTAAGRAQPGFQDMGLEAR